MATTSIVNLKTNRFYCHVFELDSVISPSQLSSFKLVTRYGLGLNDQRIHRASCFSHLYHLIEEEYILECPSIVVHVLSRLGLPERYLFFLREKTHDVIYSEYISSCFPLLDLILTSLYIFTDLPEVKFNYVKSIVTATFCLDLSSVKTPSDLVELLLTRRILNVQDSGMSLRHVFAWLEVSSCSLYRQYLVRHCVDCIKAREPQWKDLVKPLRKSMEAFGGIIDQPEQLFYTVVPLEEGITLYGSPSGVYGYHGYKWKNQKEKDIIKYKPSKISNGHGTTNKLLSVCSCLLVMVVLFLTGSVITFFAFVIIDKYIHQL